MAKKKTGDERLADTIPALASVLHKRTRAWAQRLDEIVSEKHFVKLKLSPRAAEAKRIIQEENFGCKEMEVAKLVGVMLGEKIDISDRILTHPSHYVPLVVAAFDKDNSTDGGTIVIVFLTHKRGIDVCHLDGEHEYLDEDDLANFRWIRPATRTEIDLLLERIL